MLYLCSRGSRGLLSSLRGSRASCCLAIGDSECTERGRHTFRGSARRDAARAPRRDGRVQCARGPQPWRVGRRGTRPTRPGPGRRVAETRTASGLGSLARRLGSRVRDTILDSVSEMPQERTSLTVAGARYSRLIFKRNAHKRRHRSVRRTPTPGQRGCARPTPRARQRAEAALSSER